MRRTVRLGLAKKISKREARMKFQKYLDRVNVIVTPPPKSGKMLKDFIPEWQTKILTLQSLSSQRAANSHIKSHVTPRLGDCFLTDINTKTVQTFVTALAMENRTRKTIENILGTLSSILKAAKRFDYACGQFSREELALPRNGTSKEAPMLTAVQVGTIIANAPEPYATMFAVLGMTGMRAGEVLALRVSDLDFEKKLIHVRRAIDSRTREDQPTKSNASAATLPISPELEKRLQRFLAGHWRENAQNLIFANQNGRPYSRGNVVERYLKPILAKHNIPAAGFHGFRHGLASELLEAGAAPSVVQRQMRHSDVRVTLTHYSHVIGDAQRVAAANLANRIEGYVQQAELESRPELEPSFS